MADRSAAAAFGQAFVTLAREKKTPKRDQAARSLWKVAGRYDFSPGQMEAYHALAKLGLIDVEDEFGSEGLPKTPDYTKPSDRWAEKLIALLKKRVYEDSGRPGFEATAAADVADAREIARIAGVPVPAWTEETRAPARSVAATLSQGFSKPTPIDEGPGWGALVLAMGLGIAFAIDQQRAAAQAAAQASA